MGILKVHTETQYKGKAKSDIDTKDKANSDTNSINQQRPIPLCDLFEPNEEEVKLEGFRQDEDDQLEELLNSEVCEESDDEE